MGITARELNRATLARQLLLQREPLGVVDAVRRLVALQAQHPASPYLALWNRLRDFAPADLDAAFAEHAVVKATLMRITLHAVHADDWPAFRAAMQPTLRAGRFDSRLTATGVTPDDAEALAARLVEFAHQPRSVAGIKAWLEDLGVAPEPGVMRALRGYTPVLHAPTGGPWSFGQRPSYLAATPPALDPDACAAGLQLLLRRYLEGFGPASVADVAQFAMVQRGRVTAALESLAGVVERLDGPDGKPLYDVPGAPRPPGETPAPPRLMAMWDSTLLAYADRARVIPPEYRKLVTRVNGDVLPTLLVDGYVAGVWRPAEGGIEASAFHPLPADTWDAVAAEAVALQRLLADREPQVYSRYNHWWRDLPTAEARLLPG